MIRQIRKPRGQAGIWLLRVATIAIVVGFCSWHLAWLNTQNAMVSVQTKQLEKPGIEKQKYDSLLGEALEKRGVAIKESAIAKSELQQVRFFFENQTDRLHLLLGKLVEFRTSELVIKQIAINEDGTVVSGVSLDSDAAPLLTNRLRDVVSSAGWKIHPASQLGLLKMTNGGPWTFSILLEDVGPPSLLREVRNNVAENGSGGSIPE